MLVPLVLSMVLVGCGESADSTSGKENQQETQELNLKAEDYMNLKNTHTLGVGTFYNVTPYGSDLLGVSDLAGPNEGYKGAVEKIDYEGKSEILFRAPSNFNGKEYGFDSLALLENGSFLVSGWSLETVEDYQVERKELLVFRPDYKLESSLVLPSEVIDLFQAAMLPSNEFIVSVQKDTGMNYIQKLDQKGNVLKELENVNSFILTNDNKVVIIDASSAIVFDQDLNELSRVDLGIFDESGKTKRVVTSLMVASDGSIMIGFDVYHIDKENPDEVGTIDMELASISVDGHVNWRKMVAKKSVSLPNSLVEYNGHYVVCGLKEHDGPERLYVLGAYSKDGKEAGIKYIQGGFSTFNQLSVIGDKLFIVSTQRTEKDEFRRVLNEISFAELVK